MLEIKFDGVAAERALLKAVGGQKRREVMTGALSKVAGLARQRVMERMGGGHGHAAIFDRPTPFTVHSIRYHPASGEALQAEVYISDDAAKGISPRKYLRPEIEGGARNMKRSERVLIAAGDMLSNQSMVPSRQFPLDRYGNVPGPKMVQILSRVKAFGEVGYAANANKRTTKRLQKLGVTIHKKTGTDYFVARGHSGQPLGIWQVTSPGQVRPVLIFTDKRPAYRARFPFVDLVMDVFNRYWSAEVVRALIED